MAAFVGSLAGVAQAQFVPSQSSQSMMDDVVEMVVDQTLFGSGAAASYLSLLAEKTWNLAAKVAAAGVEENPRGGLP